MYVFFKIELIKTVQMKDSRVDKKKKGYPITNFNTEIP